MTMQLDANTVLDELRGVTGPVYTAADGEYASEVAGFNLAVEQHPMVVVGALDTNDVVTAVRVAKDRGWKVAVQTTGHGAQLPIDAEIMISTRRMDSVDLDLKSKIASIGGGARWSSVIAVATEHGLLPNSGSSPNVGVVGYLMGGGLGPLVRSFGYSSDYIVGATVVTGEGEALEVTAESHPDLFWAIRGGKYELGIVTEIRLRLAEVSELYAGSLLFAETDIPAVLAGWSRWAMTAPDDVSTSVVMATFPDLDGFPPFLRGRRVAMMRFAYPGDAVEGEALAAPLRALAPVEMDAIRPMEPKDVAQIHNDPTDPGPSWLRGAFLSSLPDQVVDIVLDSFGAGSPFTLCELRHIGSPVDLDAEGGSAVGGREVQFTMGFGTFNPGTFAQAPSAADRMLDRLEKWLAPITNVNFAGEQDGAAHPLATWSPETQHRLVAIRRTHDPRGVFRRAQVSA